MRYFMFNKPKNCVTAKKDALNKTVMDYFPCELAQQLHPVGRLDKDTEGLLFITDDGSFTFDLMQPKNHVSKKYFFYAIGELDDEKIKQISDGVKMRGIDIPALPAKITCEKTGVITEIDGFLAEDKKERLLKNPNQKIFSGYITINEGKNHQVKRMLRAIDCCVVYLKRVAIGTVMLDNSLEYGAYRELTDDELAALKK